MLARLQRIVVAVLIASLLAAAIVGFTVGSVAVVAAWVAVVVSAYAGGLALEFAWLYRSYAANDARRPSLAMLMRAWAKELWVAPRIFLWRQPFRSRVEADHVPYQPRGPGVIFVHGFFCNRGIWNIWMKQLRHAGHAFVAINLEPVFGSIDDHAERIEEAVRTLEASTRRLPIIVAHSMGGLAARAWARQFGGAARIGRLVTIATPHAGTALARHSRFRNGRQMRIDSPWLAALRSDEDSRLAARSTCFWSHCDNIVFPTQNATWSGADNRHLVATPHVHMVQHSAIYAEVRRLLDAPESNAVGE